LNVERWSRKCVQCSVGICKYM